MNRLRVLRVVLTGLELITAALLISGLLVGGFGGLQKFQLDWPTLAMVFLVLVVWGTYELRGEAWSRRERIEPAVDPQAPSADPGLLLDTEARRRAFDYEGRLSLGDGDAGRIVEEMGDRVAWWNLPSWLSGGQAVLVALGLVGTFVGLTWGLLEAVPLMATRDPEAMTDGMNFMLAGAKLAFLKSLAGVWCGLLWGLRYRVLEDQHRSMLAAWRKWLDDRYPPVSGPQLLARIGADAADREVRFAAVFNQLNATLVGVRDSLDATTRRESGLIRSALSEVGARDTALLAGTVEASREALAGQLDQQVTRLIPALEKSLDELGDRVAQLAETLPDRIGSQTGTMLEPAFQQLTQAVHQLSTTGATTIGETLQANLSGEISTLGGSLGEVAEMLHGLVPRVATEIGIAETRMLEGAGTAARALNEAGQAVSNDLRGAAAQLSAETTSFQSATLAVREILAEAEAVARALRGAGTDVANGLTGIATPLLSLPTVLERTQAAIDTAGAALSIGTESAMSTVAQAERATSVLAAAMEAQTSLGDAARSLTTDIDRVREACDVTVTALNSASAGQQLAGRDAAVHLAETVASFRTSLEEAQRHVAAASVSTFEGAQAITIEASRTMAEALQASSATLEQSMARMAVHSGDLERGMTGAAALIDSIEGYAFQLHASAEATSKPFADIAGALEVMSPELSQAALAVRTEREALTGLGRQLEVQAQQLATASAQLTLRSREYQSLQGTLSKEWAIHLNGVEVALARIRASWTEANAAAVVGVAENAKAIGAYARRMEESLTLPKHLARIDGTLEDLTEVMAEVREAVTTLSARP